MSQPSVSAATARTLLARQVSEAEFQRGVIKEAKFRGWLVQHSRPAYSKSGKVSTPIQGHKGFPDLVLVRVRDGAHGNLVGQVIFAELKKVGSYPTPDQRAWLDALRESGADVRIWRPTDWDEIHEALA